MMRGKWLGRALLLGLSMFLSANAGAQQPQPAPPASKPAEPPGQAVAPAVEPVVEPRAIDLLKASSSRLAAARSMRFTAVVSYESPSRPGPALVYATRSEVTLQRPEP